jgi:hypothetical protein
MIYKDSALSTTWQTYGPLAAEELWQCRKGKILITLEAVTDNDQGAILSEGDGLYVAAGKTVRVRKLTNFASWLNREVTG